MKRENKKIKEGEKMIKKINLNFLECNNVEEANAIDLSVYTFVRYSDSRDKYIFKIREEVRK